MKLLLGVLFAVFGCLVMVAADKPATCFLPHSKDGNGIVRCAAYIPSWTYDHTEGKCLEFIYGGCSGNDNRFGSQKDCEAICK